MNFLALILGLAVERFLTNLFHLREFNWLDSIFDKVLTRLSQAKPFLLYAVIAAVLILLVLPVVLIEVSLMDTLAYIPGFFFAVIVLLFCLGPRDLNEEVADLRRALAQDEEAEIVDLTLELLEVEPADEIGPEDLESAIYAQANNRIFGVVFWFIVLGAAGAWLFRVTDMLRKEALQKALRDDAMESAAYLPVILRIHGVLAWIPARLLMVSYSLAGSYDGATAAWKAGPVQKAELFPTPDDRLLGTVGRGAATSDEAAELSDRIQVALDFVNRTLWMIWCPALALLTLYDWIS